MSFILSLSARDEYGNTYPPYEGEYSILTLPVRESIEILPLSVRVSISMFSAHIKENGITSPISIEYWHVSSTYLGMKILPLSVMISIGKVSVNIEEWKFLLFQRG